MEAHVTVESDHITIGVVDYFQMCGRFGQEDGTSPAKRFPIDPMLRDMRENVFEEAALATGMGKSRFKWQDVFVGHGRERVSE
jgi:hypothetical protein